MSEGDMDGITISSQEPNIPKRPGGELHIRPIVIDGTVYDPYGAPKLVSDADGNLSYVGGKPLESADTTTPTEETPPDKDEEYARRFWERGRPEGLREVMTDIVRKAAEQENGSIGSFVSPEGIDEKDREKLSAYRQLARSLGYEVGQYVFSPDGYTAQASIKKPKDE